MLGFLRKTRPVFVFGAQRSGTTICQRIFLNSRQVEMFTEGNRAAMTAHYRLRDDDGIRRLIRRSRRAVTLFKPLLDSQWADRCLETFDGARAIWIYRDPADTANSAVAKWGDSQRQMITLIGKTLAEVGTSEAAVEALRDRPGFATCSERLSEPTIAQLIEWGALELDPYSGAAAMWWLRNQFFRCLGRDPRVLTVRYESLVSDPAAETARMCEHMGIRYDDALIAEVHARSIGRRPQPDIEPSVARACATLKTELDSVTG